MRKEGSHGSPASAQHDRADEVFHRILVDGGVSAAEKIREYIFPDIHKGGIQDRCHEASPERKGRCGFYTIFFLSAQGAGDNTRSSDTKQIRNGGEKHKGWHTYGNCGQHGIVSGESHKKCIRHVVDNQNDLSNYCRKCQSINCFWNAAVFKQILFLRIQHAARPFEFYDYM